MGEWVFYNVGLPLIGVPLIWIVLWLIDNPKRFRTIVRDGQLCFFSTTLCASAVHDFIVANRPYSNVVIAVLLVFIIVFDAFYAVALLSDRVSNLSAATFEKRMGLTSLLAVVICVTVVVVARAYWNLT